MARNMAIASGFESQQRRLQRERREAAELSRRMVEEIVAQGPAPGFAERYDRMLRPDQRREVQSWFPGGVDQDIVTQFLREMDCATRDQREFLVECMRERNVGGHSYTSASKVALYRMLDVEDRGFWRRATAMPSGRIHMP